MKTDLILTKAARLANKGKYGDAIQILEPEIVRYHDSFRYHYILGTSCLYSKDYGGAFTYLKRARDIKMQDPSVLLGIAYLFLHRGETDRAVDLYLEILELEPENSRAKKALGVIQKQENTELLIDFLESGKLKKILPPLVSVPFSFRKLILPLIVILACFFAVGTFQYITRSREQRSGYSISALIREEQNLPVGTDGTFRYILTKNEVLAGYERARRYFTEYRDEAAKTELNRILESNASDAVKNKARLLISYTSIPGFENIKDRFLYSQVAADPILYRDCHVVWKGMATNLDEKENSTNFQFLVGYDTRNTLEGIISVKFDRVILLDTNYPLEVLGRVVPSSSDTRGSFRLEGIAIHQEPALKR